jgi:hypothetical protein
LKYVKISQTSMFDRLLVAWTEKKNSICTATALCKILVGVLQY